MISGNMLQQNKNKLLVVTPIKDTGHHETSYINIPHFHKTLLVENFYH
jgi:hypothetical protein